MKELVFVTEARFIRGRGDKIYGDPAFNYSLWCQYLQGFDKVYVFARIKNDELLKTKETFVSSGPNVEFVGIEYFKGPTDYVLKSLKIKKEIKRHLDNLMDCYFICRIPGVVGDLVISELIKRKKKYAVEVVGDPEEVFAADNFTHPLRRLIKNRYVSFLKRNVFHADASLFVTSYYLQKKYPPNELSYHTAVSNVILSSEIMPLNSKLWEQKVVYNLLSVGSLEQMYKSPDVLIEALEIINNQNEDFKVQINWLGSGKFLKPMRELATKKGLFNDITFLGDVDKNAVFEYMSKSDLFILASRTEGLPRVVVEAMSIGLPIIGTNVGGIPELLSAEVLVEKNNPQDLANSIIKILKDENFYNSQAQRNLLESQNFTEDKLNLKRLEFYQFIQTDL
jgi:glycosyltransferase involved in cell wall biosynthesis